MPGPSMFIRQQCPVATSANDGLMSLQQAQALSSVAAAGITTLYVDAATGDDSNSGAQGSPLKTFDAAWNKFPAVSAAGICVMRLGLGDYALSDGNYFPPTSSGLIRAGAENALPLQIIGTAINELGSLVTTGGSNTTYVAAVTTVNGAQRGAFLRNLDNGKRYCIKDNTFSAGHTTFTINGYADPIIAGTNFVVERPGSNLVVPFAGVPAFQSNAASVFIGFKDIKFKLDQDLFGGFPFIVLPESSNAIFEAVEMDLGSYGRFMYFPHKGHMNFRFDVEVSFGPAFDAGVYAHCTPGSYGGIYSDDKSVLFGHIVADDVQLGMGQHCNLGLDAVSLRSTTANSLIAVDRLSLMTIQIGDISGYDVTLDYGAIGQYGDLAGLPDLVVKDAPTSAFTLNNGSAATFGGVSGQGTTPDFGIKVDSCSHARINQFGGTTTVSGVTGQTRVGAVTKAYAALPYSEVDASGPTLNRIQ